MTTNLIQLVSRELGGGVLNKIAGDLGEEPSRVQSALDGAVTGIVGGLVNKASTTQGAADLLDFLKRNNFDNNRFTSAANATAGPDGVTRLIETGSSLLDSIFGPRTNAVVDWVTSLGGIRRASSASLLSLAVPIVLGQVGRLVGSTGWSASSLMNLLAEQKKYLQNLPAGLASALGLGTAEYAATGRRAAEREPYVTEPRRESSWWKWVLPLLALLALVILLNRFFSGREEQVQTRIAQPTATLSAVATPTTTAIVRPDLGAFLDVKLPNGVILNIPSNGVESKLLAFIKDPAQRVDKENWFSFDRLEFETDSARLKPTSEEQLSNIAEILKAYPNVNVKIGGYTDNVGDDAYNMKLSQNRANNTMGEIVNRGIAQSRLAAEGYGEQHPVADNATEEGRQRNRRIDIRVTKK